MIVRLDTDYEIIQGIKCYAPDLAFESEDYPAEHFSFKLFDVEARSFWFRSRNRILAYLFSKYLGTSLEAKVLEIGCGTGFVLQALSKFHNYKLYGAELYLEALKLAKARLPNVEFVQADFRKAPFQDEFDAVGAFDVLEHIDDDIQIMRCAYKSLKKNGLFFISVPQHRWLWSVHDEIGLHKRRYTRKEMIKKLNQVGFSIKFINSFVSLLLPLMLLSRLRRDSKSKSYIKYSYDELILPDFFDKALDFVMRIDELFIKLGLPLLIGGSLLVVARK